MILNPASILYTIFIYLTLAFTPAFSSNISLDTLFEMLKNADSEKVARQYENEIWKNWLNTGEERIDKMMQKALRKREGYDFNGSLQILNQIIKLKPQYAEGWNQRATVYFHQSKYEKSLWDIDKTLELEPRHFGALAGRAVIRLQQGKPALARQNVLKALQFHPYLKERAFFPDLLPE